MPRPSAWASLIVVVPAEAEAVEDRHEHQRLADIEGQGHPPDRRQQPQQRLRGGQIELDEKDQLDGHQRERDPARDHPVERLPRRPRARLRARSPPTARAWPASGRSPSAAAATSRMRRGFTKVVGPLEEADPPEDEADQEQADDLGDPPGREIEGPFAELTVDQHWRGPARRTRRRRPRRGSCRS